ncbi:MAG: 16S rRNA (cytosine(1402)-N(4))-methyltransferase RsmH [Ruminococcaceae bacterium]|nr:16S rRNA (cytosine(1402)-N(4))-methyltransferase RsmH [Oscillospiraceae bacterium]
MSEFVHKSVLFEETVDALCVKPDGIYADLTLGGGGHSGEILNRLSTGHLYAVDRDMDAIEHCSQKFGSVSEKVTLIHRNYASFGDIIVEYGINRLDGVCMDLGVSSHQLDLSERGFSYMKDAPLDMRMNREDALSAYDVVNGYSRDELKRILYQYGEETFAPKIASEIDKQRQIKPIETTLELSEIIKNALPPKAREGGHHPAKKSFQAIRIAVNGELDAIEPAIRSAVDALSPGGRIAVITFHSLEDRIVKQTFADLEKGCTCPKDFPVCVCGKKPQLRAVNRKPILPSEEELENNPRSRSAKLRVAEKC